MTSYDDKGGIAQRTLAYVEYKTEVGMFKRKRMKTFENKKPSKMLL
jgi:hypothetical protein